MNFDINKIRDDFPILKQKVYNKPLIYLDNAATTQKPQQVIDAIVKYYSEFNSNIHRGVHYLSEKSTELYENARENIKQFINANSRTEIVFTKGTTEAINMVAYSFTEGLMNEGDEIIITQMEHHSNMVPWQLACERKNLKLKYIPLNNNGELQLDKLQKLITDKTKLIALTWISNSLGTINPVKDIIDKAHALDIPVLVDAAQAVQHQKVDVQKLECDFLVFSGHKIFAETGIGIMYGKEKWLEKMPPYQGGGDMIKNVTLEKSTWAELPLKFEAGTSNFVGALSLSTAIDYIKNIGLDNIADYESELLNYATQEISQIEDIQLIGTAQNKCSVVSFNLNNIHHYDAGMVLDKMGIAVRTGTHCTEPVMRFFNISGTIRASFSFYNTKDEIIKLKEGIIKVKNMFL